MLLNWYRFLIAICFNILICNLFFNFYECFIKSGAAILACQCYF